MSVQCTELPLKCCSNATGFEGAVIRIDRNANQSRSNGIKFGRNERRAPF
jgi:hypothetical protein